MARERYTIEEIIREFREADELIGQGQMAANVSRNFRASDIIYYRWR